jgi:hypothetical protein
MNEKQSIPCEGGILDGKVIHKDEPEPVIHQSGMFVIRLHRPYPKRKGEKVTDHLHTYWEDYTLYHTEQGPVYRCDNPWGGEVMVGDTRLERTEGGAFVAYADADGKLRARR